MSARAGFSAITLGATLLLTGCLASKGDVALLRGELRSMRDASAQASAAERQHIDQLLAQISRTNDSLRVVSQRLAKLQGDVQTSSYDMGRQILQIQELVGQSGKRMQELRAALEERNQQTSSTAVPAAGDSSRPAANAPGQAQLFQSSYDQLRRGSTGVARNGFEELLRIYPASENAPDAMVYIAETYARERNQVAADSVYDVVIQKYPRSPKAATALYKRALSMRAAGQNVKARAALERIVREFPNADEVVLARDQLRSLP